MEDVCSIAVSKVNDSVVWWGEAMTQIVSMVRTRSETFVQKRFSIFKKYWWLLGVLLVLVEGVGVWQYRGLYLVQFRQFELVALGFSLLSFIVGTLFAAAKDKQRRIQLLAFSGFFSSLFAQLSVKELTFQLQKMSVLGASTLSAQAYGTHFIVGYTSFDDVKKLAADGTIAGIFLTRRNVEGKTIQQVRKEIDELQQIRSHSGFAPLIVTTDQEGGVVSKLSPPLEYQPPLNALLNSDSEMLNESEQEIVREYAQKQANGLKELGVTVNLSPVLDLQPDKLFKNDEFTKIRLRSLSTTPEKVSSIAAVYAVELKRNGITPTFKHFPGIGSVSVDTHISGARLETPLSDLLKTDLIPFKQLGQDPDSLMMLSHVVLTDVDPDHPVSFSKPVVQNLVKTQLHIKSKLITDDFSMGAVVNSNDGVNGAVDKALDAGVDYILFAYDPDLYYQAMEHLLRK